MNVLIVGYGGMGREIERILTERGHTISGRVDPAGGSDVEPRITPRLLEESDLAIEFAQATGVVDNARSYAEAGVSAVVGTTGWEDRRTEVRKIIEEKKGSYLWGSNYSVGAHLFLNLVERAATLLNRLPDYDILVMEMHHSRKKDSPSGTALTTGERILKVNERKKRIVDSKLDRRIEPDELHIASLRGGAFPGVHTVFLDSFADTIEIKHSAHNRSGFALGAVMAAEWLHEKQGFFRVEDFITELLEERSQE
jgi:4-hydroxy-tetrahydrodipicolinate reductase